MYGSIRRRLRWRMGLPVLGVAVAGAVSLAVALSGCAVAGESCVFTGSAIITPGLSTKGQPFSYTFTGTLSNCKSTLGDPTIKSGTVSASGSGSGSCATSSTAGTATIRWSNGQTSVLAFSTKGALAGLAVTAKVTSGEFAGQSAASTLIFQPVGGPQACASPTGVTKANFTGVEAPS